MLEKQLSAILAQQLRAFIQNVNEEQLRISLWSGDLVLHDLTLRPDVLDQVIKLVIANTEVEGGSESAAAAAKALLLPFTVINGVVRTLKISVPWTALLGEPVSVELDGIELVLGPLRSRPYSGDEESNRSGAIQSKQLQQFDRYRASKAAPIVEPSAISLQNPAASSSVTDASKNSSSATSLITTIARNAHIVIRNIACKYLHDYCDLDPSLASMLELIIDEIFVSTTDDEWRARFVSDPTMPICKEISVEGLMISLYHDKKPTIDGSTSESSWGSRTTLLRGGDATIRVKAPAPQQPASGSSKTTQPPTPTDVLVQMNPTHVDVTFDAIKHLYIIGESFSPRYVDCSEYRTFLHTLVPQKSGSADSDQSMAPPQHSPVGASRIGPSRALRRWRFAILSVVHHLGRRRRIFQTGDDAYHHHRQWPQLKLFCNIRREYIGLYKRSMSVRWLPVLGEKDHTRLESIEATLRVDQIVFLRCLAHAELSFEREVDERQRVLIHNTEQKKPASGGGSRWTSWMYRGGGTQQTATPTAPQAEPTTTVGFNGLQERIFVANAFEREWKMAAEFLSLKERLQPTAAAAAAATAAAAAAASSTASLIRLHCELSLFSLRILPDLLLRHGQHCDSRFFHISMLQGLRQSILCQVGDIQADVNFGSRDVRHILSSEVGFCKVFVESSGTDTDPVWSLNMLDSTTISEPRNGVLNVDESSPLTSSFLTIGLTMDNHLDLLVQPFVLRLPVVEEIPWWAAAANAFWLEMATLPFSNASVLAAPVAAPALPSSSHVVPLNVSVVLRQVFFECILDAREPLPTFRGMLEKAEFVMDHHGHQHAKLSSLGMTHPNDGGGEDLLLQIGNLRVDVKGDTTEVDHPGNVVLCLHQTALASLGDALRGIQCLSSSRRGDDSVGLQQLHHAAAAMMDPSFEGAVRYEKSTCAIVLPRCPIPLSFEWSTYWELRSVLAMASLRLAPTPVEKLHDSTTSPQRQPYASTLIVSTGGLEVRLPTQLTAPTDNEPYAQLTFLSARNRSEGDDQRRGVAPLILRVASSFGGAQLLSNVELRGFAIELSAFDGDESLIQFPSVDLKVSARTHTTNLASTSSTTVEVRIREMSEVVVSSTLVGCVETIQSIASTFTSSIIPPICYAAAPAHKKSSSDDVAVKCTFDEGVRLELFETLQPPPTSEFSQQQGDTLNTLADGLYHNPSPVAAHQRSSECCNRRAHERSLCILEVERISASFTATDAESRVALSGVIGSMQQVSPVADGELFAVMGCGTSKSQYAQQTFDVKLVIPANQRGSEAGGTDIAGTCDPALVVQARLKGGKMCYNHPFVMKLSGIAADPMIARLCGLSAVPVCSRGLSMHGSWIDAFLPHVSRTAEERRSSEEPTSAQQWTKLDITVEALELLCATDATVAVLEESPTSFVRFVIDRVEISSTQMLHNRRHPFIRTVVNIHRLCAERDAETSRMFTESSSKASAGDDLYELIGLTEVQISSNLLCLFDAASQQYQYQYTPSNANTTTLVSLKRQAVVPTANSLEGSPSPVASSGAVEMSITVTQYTALMNVLFRNIMSPLVPEVSATPTPSANLPFSILMLNASNVRCYLTTSTQRCVFALKLQQGLRFYQISGGSLHSPQMALDLSGIVIEDCSPSVVNVDRTVPKAKQTSTLVPSLGSRRIIYTKRLSLRMREEAHRKAHSMPGKVVTSSLAVTDVELDTLTICPYIGPLMILRDALVNATVSELLTSPTAPTALRDQSDGVEPFVSSRTTVDVRNCTVSFCEPWGEPLADLCVDHTRVVVLGLSDSSQRIHVDVMEPFTLSHSMFEGSGMDDVPYRYQCLLSSSKHHHGEPAATPNTNTPSAATPAAASTIISVEVVVPAAQGGTSRVLHTGVAQREQPHPVDLGDVSVTVRDLCVVGLPNAWVRLIQFINGEFIEVANLPYSPEQRASFGHVPYFAFSNIDVVVDNTSILVPCSIATALPKQDNGDLTNGTGRVPSLDCWEVVVKNMTVTNRWKWSSECITFQGGERHHLLQHTHTAMLARVEEYVVSVNDLHVHHSFHRRVGQPPILAIDRVSLISPMVIPTDTVVAAHLDTAQQQQTPSPSSTTQQHHAQVWTILPLKELTSVLFHQDLIVEVEHPTVSVHPLLVPCVQRCVATMQASIHALPSTDKYYVTSADPTPANPYGFQQDVMCSVLNTEVILSETQAPRNTSTASHFNHQAIREQHPVHISFLKAFVGEVVVKMSSTPTRSSTVVNVPGALTVTDQDGHVLLFRSSENDNDSIATISVSSTTEQRQAASPQSSSIPASPVSYHHLVVETGFICVVAQLFTVDAALRVQNYIKQVPTAPSQPKESTNAGPQETHSSLVVRCHSTAVQVADVAVLHVRTISLSPSSATSGQQLSATSHQCIALEGISVTRPRSALPFVDVGTAEVKVGSGDLQIRIQRAHVCNYSSAFFIDIIETVNSLQEYLHINTKLPVEQEEGYRQTLLISLKDLKLSLFPGGAETPRAPRLDLVFPGFVVRSVQTTISSETSVDSEDGSIVYEHPNAEISTLPICRGMALTFQLSSNELHATSTTNVKLGPISIVVPIGSVLQNFVEVIATSLVPFSKVVLFPSSSPGETTTQNRRNKNAAADAITASASQHVISLFAPKLSLHVCDATTHRQSADSTGVPKTLFGVDVHQVRFAHRITPAIDKVELSVFEVTSVVDRSIQCALVSCSPMQLDDELTPAILVRREVSTQVTTPSDGAQREVEESTTGAYTRSKHEKISVRLHELDATISPALLSMINENILERVAIASQRVKENVLARSYSINQHQTPKRGPTSSTASGGAGKHSVTSSGHSASRPGSGPSRQAACAPPVSVITIHSTEHRLKQDLVLGGKQGSVLHFTKQVTATHHSGVAAPINTIQLCAPVGGVATVYLSYIEGADGQLYFPIVVDPGLSVVTEGIRFVLPANGLPSQRLTDFAHLGERSFLHCDASMVIIGSSHSREARFDSPSILRPGSSSKSSSALRYTRTVDILASLALRCWSFHQAVSVTLEIRGQYRSESARNDDLSSSPRVLLDEQGDLTVSNLSVVSDAGNITSQPTGVVLNIGYFKPSDEDDVKVVCPRTVVRAIIPSSTFMMSIGHAKLMYDILGALQRGSEHIGSIDLAGETISMGEEDDEEEGIVEEVMKSLMNPSENTNSTSSPLPSKRSAAGCAGSTGASASKRVFVPLPKHAIELLSSPQRRVAPVKSSRVEFGLTAPQMCMILTDDFFHPMTVLSVDNIAVQGNTNRSMTDVNVTLSMEITLRDYPEIPCPPTQSHDGSRLLLSVSPELAIGYNIIECGASREQGHALQIAGAAARLEATIPLNTMLKLLVYRFADQKTGAHSFLNNVGVPLIIMGSDGHPASSNAPICELPMDVVVKADIFRYDQTLFRVMNATPQAMRQESGASAPQLPQGQTVDLRWLHAGASVGLSFLASACQHPLCEVMMRLDTIERKVTFSSLVTFVNKLSDFKVVLPSPEEHFVVEPRGGKISAPIPVLQHVMQLVVCSSNGGKWSLLDPVSSNSFFQWDALLGAYCAACEEDMPEADRDDAASARSNPLMNMKGTMQLQNGVLSLPLTLRRHGDDDASTQEPSSMEGVIPTPHIQEPSCAPAVASATRCVLLQVHRQPIPHYIDASVAAAAVGRSALSSSWAKHEVIVTISPVTRFVNFVGAEMSLRLKKANGQGYCDITLPSEGAVDWFDPIVFDAASPTTIEVTIQKDIHCTLRSVPRALPEDPNQNTWITMKDENMREMHIRIRRDSPSGHFHVYGTAVVENRTRFAIELFSGNGGVLLAGQEEKRGVDPQRECDVAALPIGFLHPKEESVSIRARVCRPAATVSQPFQVTSLLPSSLLSCGEAHLLHVFSARREIAAPSAPAQPVPIPSLRQCPRIILEPTWWLVNQHSTLLLYVRAVGLDDHVSSVLPGEKFALTTFHISCGADPAIQVCFSIDGKPTFEWSPPLPLATLTSNGTCRTIRHKARVAADVHAALHLGAALSHTHVYANKLPATNPHSSPNCEEDLFTCLKVVTSRSPADSAVLVSCYLSHSEVLIENRTCNDVVFSSNFKGFKSAKPETQFLVPSFSDAAAAWTGSDPTESFVLHLQAICPKGKKHVLAIDLMAQSTARDAMTVADGLWLLTTYDATRHMYFVAVVTSRALEGSLVPQPRSMINMEFFCRKIHVHVAAKLVHGSALAQVDPPKAMSLDQLPVASAARRRMLWCCSRDVVMDDDSSTPSRSTRARDATILRILSQVELDLLRVDVESVYFNICSNGAHRFGEFTVQSISVQDCCVENPHFPIVLSIRGKHLHSAKFYNSVEEQPQPAITLQAHFGQSSIISSYRDVSGNRTTSPLPSSSHITATSIQKLLFHVEPITVKVSDTFLYSLRLAATAASQQSTEHAASRASHTAPPQLSRQPQDSSNGAVRCRIERLSIHPVQVEFTLHRRSDGRFNPLEGLPIGILVPSIEEAPISLGELVLADVLQTGSSTAECIVSCVVPFYRSRAILQSFKALGSMELIGNPMMFATNVSSGVRSFVKNTVDMHPWQGTKTLFASTTSSALHSIALLSKVGGRATAALSRDTEWLSARELSGIDSEQQVRPSGLLMSFASGVVSGVTGVVRDPMRGIQTGGATGFCTGLITGMVGVVSRPVSGILDGLGNTAEDLSSAIKPELAKSSDRSISMSNCNRNYVTQIGSTSSLDDVEQVSSVSKTMTPVANPSSQMLSAPMGRGVFIPRNRFIQIACDSSNSASSEKERWRLLFHTLGAHNVARHAPWKEFVRHSTPEEFAEMMHLALEGIVAKYFIELRAGAAAPLPTATTPEKEALARTHRLRAMNIKASLGPSDALKYITTEQFVSVACVSEVKLAVPPQELQRKVAPVVKEHVEGLAAVLLNASWL